jgi:hypothetical protein
MMRFNYTIQVISGLLNKVKDSLFNMDILNDDILNDDIINDAIISEFDNIKQINWCDIEHENSFLLNNFCIYSSMYILPTISFKTIHTSILYDMAVNMFNKFLSHMYNIDNAYSDNIIEIFREFYFKLDKVIYDIENICENIKHKSIVIYKSIEYYVQRIFIMYNTRGPICNLAKFNTLSLIEIYINYIINYKSINLYNELHIILDLKHNKTSYLNELILQLSVKDKTSLKEICDNLPKIYNINISSNLNICDEYGHNIRIYKLYFSCYEKDLIYKYDEYKILFCVYLLLLFNDTKYHNVIGRITLFTLVIGNNSKKNKVNFDKLLLRLFTFINSIKNTQVKTNFILSLLYLCDINKEYLLDKRHKYIRLKYLYDYTKYNIEDIRNNLKKFIL